MHLTTYDLYAMARYEQVHAALVDWQQFQSAAGVGLSNFKKEKPWRPPSLLLEADPPRHDAPRRVLQKVLSPRSLRKLRDGWLADAEALVDEVLAEGLEFDGKQRLADAFPLRVFPDAVGLGPDGRENLLPYGDHAFNAFGPANDLVAKGAPRVAELSAWVAAQCRREALAPEGFGARHLGGRGPRRHHARAGAADRPLAAHGRRRHDGARHRRRPLRVRDQSRTSGSGCARSRAWPGPPSTRPCAGSRRCRRSSAPRPPTSASASTSSPRDTRS